MLIKPVLYLHLVAEGYNLLSFQTPVSEISFLPISFDRPVAKDASYETLLQSRLSGANQPNQYNVTSGAGNEDNSLLFPSKNPTI